MDLNGLKTAFSVLSLVALVLAVVLFFSHDIQKCYVFIAAGVILKVAEVVIRIVMRHRKNKEKEEYGYYDK